MQAGGRGDLWGPLQGPPPLSPHACRHPAALTATCAKSRVCRLRPESPCQPHGGLLPSPSTPKVTKGLQSEVATAVSDRVPWMAPRR